MIDKFSEFEIIRRHFVPLSSGARGAENLKDDVSILDISPNSVPVVSVDTMVGGIHFFLDDPPAHLAKKLLRVNLSDLISSGAKPVGYFLSISLPEGVGNQWITDFADGLKSEQDLQKILLYGGDTTSTPGPISLSITAFGEVPSKLIVRRSSARLGDFVYVTGTIGAASVGLYLIKKLGMKVAMENASFAVSRYREPPLLLDVAKLLRGRANAAIDISDGLLADAGHICSASEVAMEIDFNSLPLSPEMHLMLENQPELKNIIPSGGDDYEILFCASEENGQNITEDCKTIGIQVSKIGRVIPGQCEVKIVDGDGKRMLFETMGWEHF